MAEDGKPMGAAGWGRENSGGLIPGFVRKGQLLFKIGHLEQSSIRE